MAKHGKPEIFNTDQSSQFTCAAFTGVLIALDSKGAWHDNVCVERIWKSVKYEGVYLRAYDSVGNARASLGRYIEFYNQRRPHSSLDRMTPDEAYFGLTPLQTAACTSPRSWEKYCRAPDGDFCQRNACPPSIRRSCTAHLQFSRRFRR